MGHDKKLKRDVLIADHTTTAKVVLWEQQVNSLEKGKSYTLKNVHVNELPKNDFGNNKSKKPFHYCSVPFRRTVITVLFVCRFRRRYRSVLPSESFRFVSFRLCTLTVPAEIVERASDWPSGGYTHFWITRPKASPSREEAEGVPASLAFFGEKSGTWTPQGTPHTVPNETKWSGTVQERTETL